MIDEDLRCARVHRLQRTPKTFGESAPALDSQHRVIVQSLLGDGAVDAFDLAALLGSWGPCDGCPADIFDDGDVNAGDLVILLGNWGACE